jgi:hypothetical protein
VALFDDIRKKGRGRVLLTEISVNRANIDDSFGIVQPELLPFYPKTG